MLFHFCYFYSVSEKSFQRTQSAAVVPNGIMMQPQHAIGSSASTNQLPSPVISQTEPGRDLPPVLPRNNTNNVENNFTGKSATTSAASFTLTSTASITSSRGTEDSEDDHRRKVRSSEISYELFMHEISSI